MLTQIRETIGACFELLRLGLITGFRFKGPYWQWRLHTAFGQGKPPRREMMRATLDYGRWIYRMRRM